MSILSLCVVAAFAAAAPARAQDPCPHALLGMTAPSRAMLDGALCEINRIRKHYGRRRVDYDLQLILAAWNYAGRMGTEGFFAHEAPDGSTLATRLEDVKWPALPAGTLNWRAHEVLGRGCREFSTARAMVAAWILSPTHRRAVLARHARHVGIGVAPAVAGARCADERIWAVVLAGPAPTARAARRARAKKRDRAPYAARR